MKNEHSMVPWYTSDLRFPLPTTVVPVIPPSDTTSATSVAPSVPKDEPSSSTEADLDTKPPSSLVLELPLPMPAPLPEEPPAPEESLPYVPADDDNDDLTQQQEEILLQSSDGPSDLPGDEEWEATEADLDLDRAWNEMRASCPEPSYEQKKEYLRWQFPPSDLRQYDYAVSRGGSLMSRRRKDDSATTQMALQVIAATSQEPEPLPPLELGEEPVLKHHAPQQVKVWPREPTGVIWKASMDDNNDEGPTPMA